MSLFDAYQAAGPAESLADVLTDRQQGNWLDEARDYLKEEAKATRLWDALKEGRATEEQRRRILAGLSGPRPQGFAAALTQALADGVTTLGKWYRAMKDDLIPRYHAAGMAAVGRLDPTPAILRVLRDATNKQLGFLGRFRENLRTARQLLDGTATARSRLYVAAAWAIGLDAWHRQMVADGYTMYRGVLSAADHCGSCLNRAALRWQPIGTLLPIGDGECLSRCRCHFEYR